MRDSDSEVFGGYARFYDLLYADKDYDAELRFLERLFALNGVTRGATVLDLGCGTGGHVIPLCREGYAVTGIDRSREMIAIAEGKAAAEALTPVLLVGDVRTLALGRTFDAVISMFAVVGYQLSNADLASTFRVAREHLDVGGLFTFDAWFGPAVLAQKPEAKRKTVRLDDGSALVRMATPTLDVLAQTVRVDYVVEEEGIGSSLPRVTESHTMRFLFAQEVAYFLEIAGFEVSALMPFMREGAEPTEDDWNVTWVARAV